MAPHCTLIPALQGNIAAAAACDVDNDDDDDDDLYDDSSEGSDDGLYDKDSSDFIRWNSVRRVVKAADSLGADGWRVMAKLCDAVTKPTEKPDQVKFRKIK
jgi:hypothetical protein